MDLKNYSTGVQHIGIPTNDIDKTVEFYHKLEMCIRDRYMLVATIVRDVPE